jgi:hypothetical protein
MARRNAPVGLGDDDRWPVEEEGLRQSGIDHRTEVVGPNGDAGGEFTQVTRTLVADDDLEERSGGDPGCVPRPGTTDRSSVPDLNA